jgi:hypothetical protein
LLAFPEQLDENMFTSWTAKAGGVISKVPNNKDAKITNLENLLFIYLPFTFTFIQSI